MHDIHEDDSLSGVLFDRVSPINPAVRISQPRRTTKSHEVSLFSTNAPKVVLLSASVSVGAPTFFAKSSFLVIALYEARLRMLKLSCNKIEIDMPVES